MKYPDHSEQLKKLQGVPPEVGWQMRDYKIVNQGFGGLLLTLKRLLPQHPWRANIQKITFYTTSLLTNRVASS